MSEHVGIALDLLTAARPFIKRISEPEGARARLRRAVHRAAASLNDHPTERLKAPAQPELERCLRQLLADIHAAGLSNREIVAIVNDTGWERK